MNRDDIIRMAREAGLHLATDVNWMPIIGLEYAEKFAALVAAAEREAWRNAAIRVGEDLATCGPDNYYDFTAQQWLEWALNATSKMQADYMNLGACGEREACASICDAEAKEWVEMRGWLDDFSNEIAAAIRARGQS